MGRRLVQTGPDALAGHVMILIVALLLDLGGTLITLQPPADPKALADVLFQNFAVNSELHNGTYPLTGEGLTVEVEFEWDAGDIGEDKITVYPPAGVTCVPKSCSITIMEMHDDTVTLYEWSGM